MLRTLWRKQPWLVAAGIVAATAVWWTLSARGDERRLLAGVLQARPLPASVDSVECQSRGFTDVLTTCAFAIDPADFDDLLRGREFGEEPCSNRDSWSVAGGPRVGPRFPLSSCYRATPPEFEHGGFVLVAADAARSRVIADLYIE